MNRHASIFTRILLASLLPFILVFAFTCIVVTDLIYTYNQRTVAQTVSVFANQASEKITDTIRHIESILRLTGRNMSDVVTDVPDSDSEAAILGILHSFMEGNPEIFCAWYVFTEGTINDGAGWQARSFQKRDGVIVEIPAVTELDDPDISPWHYHPFRTGKPYFDIIDYWDYGIGEGSFYTGTLAYPIVRNGVIIGTVGMDILYEQTFRFMDNWYGAGTAYRALLVSDSGGIVYSTQEELDGANLLDQGFAESDRRRIAAILKGDEPIQTELDSPLSKERSLVQIVPVVGISDAGRGLFLYLDLPTRMLYQDARALARTMFLLAGLGALVIVLATAMAARGIVRPLRRLTQLAEGIASESQDVDPLDLDNVGRAGPEVQVLARTLRNMLENMAQNHKLAVAAMEMEYEKKKLEETASARTQFFAAMSHELRTPMNAIVGIAEILSSEDLSERQRGFVKDIKSSSESLLVIINDILDISRLDAGKLTPVPSSFNLWRLLDNVASLTEYLARAKKLEFNLHRDASVPEYVYTDEVRTKQILVNLLGNAVKFTSNGFVELTARVAKGELCFDVRDTGIGIRDEDREKLFNPFLQVDTLRNRNVTGTGLGLSISMNLAKLMGGRIELESTYGKGSVFKLRLPLVVGDPTRVLSRDVDDREGIRQGSRVLVVDDNEINLRVARGLMAMFGLECDTASSGWEALEKVSASRYDLVFMDHMMPEMDGVEATRRIRAKGGLLETVPIIAFTANSVTGVEGVLMDAGMDGFLSKPIRKEALLKVLRKWLPSES